jgi:hypothetical protein
MWADGEPLLIDPGSGFYTGPERGRFRSTSAHNTVEVDSADQCDLWGDFRAAFMPSVERGAIQCRDGGHVVVRASHDGYRRLEDPVIHERTLVWLGRDGLVLVDRLLCALPHTVISRLHFAESITTPLDHLPGELTLRELAPGSLRTVSGERSPHIGTSVPIAVAEWSGRVSPRQPFGWAMTRPGVAVERDGDFVTIETTTGPPLRVKVS